MNRFEEYCSSYITPQMTLLEKFNALLEFLKQNKETNLFLSEQNWQDNLDEYNISDVVLGGYELRLFDIILFKNGYYSYVKTIGTEKFTIGDVRYFVGEKGEKGDTGPQGPKGVPVIYRHHIYFKIEDIMYWFETIGDNTPISTLHDYETRLVHVTTLNKEIVLSDDNSIYWTHFSVLSLSNGTATLSISRYSSSSRAVIGKTVTATNWHDNITEI